MVSATVEGLKQGLIFALENQERLLLLGKKWQIIVQNRFTWRRLSQELASVYEKIISMQRKYHK
jgi:glycosyltransferase involved in cell wall biosynthesis